MNSDFYISTDMVDRSIRTEFWRDTSKILYDVTYEDNEDRSLLEGSVRSRIFGNMVVGNTSFNNQICRRTPEIIRQSHVDNVLLQLIVTGGYVGDFNGTNVSVEAGDMFFLDLAQKLESRKRPGNRVTIAIPREDLGFLLSKRDVHGLVLRSGTATNKMLFNYIMGIDSTLASMRNDEVPYIQEGLMTLVKASVEGVNARDMKDMQVTLPIKQRILDFISFNISNHELSPSYIMRHFNVSHSHLYRAFEDEGGVARTIRNKRLDLAHKLLSSDMDKRLSLKQIRQKVGFPDRSTFSKFFMERFDETPQQTHGNSLIMPDFAGSSSVLHEYVSRKYSNIS